MRFSMILVPLLLTAAMVGCQGEYLGSRAENRPFRYNMGVDGPGPGVIPASHNQLVPLGGAPAGGNQLEMMGNRQMAMGSSQIEFSGPEGMCINWDVTIPGGFDSESLHCPGRHGFRHGAIYRLKISNLPGREGRDLYPTLEIAPPSAATQAYLQHSAVPVEFNDNDIDQVSSGNYITKVIYLPNREFQGFATTGVGTLVSTQLEPGVDPIVEASNRGSILAIIRMGNKDLSLQAVEIAMNGGDTPEFVGSSFPQNYISGVNAPEYGKPITETTAGIPGPPSLPLGKPAPRGARGYAFPSPPPPPSVQR